MPWAPPSTLYLHNFAYDFSSQMFGRYLLNTFLVTAALTAGQVFFGVLAAYAFAGLSFPGRDAIFWVLHYVLTIGVALFQTTMSAQWNYLLAGSVITLAPLALLFMSFQRHLIRSVTVARPR